MRWFDSSLPIQSFCGVSVAANTEECHSFNTGSNPVLRSKFLWLSSVAGARAGLKSRRIQFDSEGSHHPFFGVLGSGRIRVLGTRERSSILGTPTILFAFAGVVQLGQDPHS